MIGLIPIIVAGGVVKKFSEGFLGKPSGQAKGIVKKTSGSRSNNASTHGQLGKYRPF